MKKILIFLLLSTSVGFAQLAVQPATSGNPQDSNVAVEGDFIMMGLSTDAGADRDGFQTYMIFDTKAKKVYTIAISRNRFDKPLWTYQDLNELEEESKNKKKK